MFGLEPGLAAAVGFALAMLSGPFAVFWEKLQRRADDANRLFDPAPGIY